MARQTRGGFDDGFPDGPEQPVMMRPSFPPLTRAVKALMLVNAGVFLALFLLSLSSAGFADQIERTLALDPVAWKTDAPFVPLWQIASYGFLHSLDDPMHILMNMLVLYFFGMMLEAELGPRRFLITYFAAQILGGMCFLGLSLATGAPAHLIGASGACFGVMVAAATLWPSRPVILYFVPLTLRTMALIFVGLELFMFLVSLKHGEDGVSHVTHLGGIVWGFVAARTGLVRWDPVRAVRQAREVRAVEQAEDEEQRMDQLLEKIHREGLASLSKSEREFLKRVSSRR